MKVNEDLCAKTGCKMPLSLTSSHSGPAVDSARLLLIVVIVTWQPELRLGCAQESSVGQTKEKDCDEAVKEDLGPSRQLAQLRSPWEGRGFEAVSS